MHRTLTALTVAALALAACGDDATEVEAEPTTAAPSTTEAPAEGPEAIVSLSATATEMLFAIGAGGSVVAVDDQSDFPAEAPTTDLSGFEPNVEAIAEYEPDLVVLASDIADVVSGLDQLGIGTEVLPAALGLEDTYDQLARLGELTGHEEEAEAVVADMRSEIEALSASVPEREVSLTYFHELDDTLFTATSSTFIGEIYSLAGLTNVADEADTDASGYPQLSAEYLLEADPDLIFLADTECCGQTEETVADRPGFDELQAVQEGNVVELSDDVASRWGPRVVELLETVVAEVERVEG